MAPAPQERTFEQEEQLLERLIAGENVPLSEINGPPVCSTMLSETHLIQPFNAASLLPLQSYGFDNKFSSPSHARSSAQ
jgi:hypothetical protein